MQTYLILLRGINVGGKNKIAMSELRTCFEKLGFKNVSTFINSGNVILDSQLSSKSVTEKIKKTLPTTFKLDSEMIRILVLPKEKLEKIVFKAPKGFGSHPDQYYSDVIFIIDKTVEELMKEVQTNPEVDKAWPGTGVAYFQR